MTEVPTFPMPMTTVGLGFCEDLVRRHLDGRPAVTAQIPDGEKRILPVRRCRAQAPFVGDPRMVTGFYEWDVAMDDNRGWHVAGEARLCMGGPYGGAAVELDPDAS